MKKTFLFLLFVTVFTSSHAQLMVSKMVGKDADKYRLGYGLFTFYDFPVNEEGTKSIRLELMDLAFFQAKDDLPPFETASAKGYISIKLGYRNIFSETKTGFYLEPSVGYCRVSYIDDNDENDKVGDGVAAALEGGYSLEVGQKGHTLIFGLKYETDRTKSSKASMSSIGFRVSYTFDMFKRKE